MDLPSQDLEEYVDKFENIFSNYRLSKRNQDELLLLVKNLSAELHLVRQSESVLKSSLKKIKDCENTSINLMYLNLEVKCKELEDENNLLKKDKEKLSSLIQSEVETQKNDYVNKIKDIEEKLQSEITNLKNQLESNKICYERKEAELYNELQMSFALEMVEKEAILKSQLEDTKKSLRHAQNNASKLNCEVTQLKNRLVNLQKNPDQPNTSHYNDSPIEQIKNNLLYKYQYGKQILDSETCGCSTKNKAESNVAAVDEDTSNANHNYYKEVQGWAGNSEDINSTARAQRNSRTDLDVTSSSTIGQDLIGANRSTSTNKVFRVFDENHPKNASLNKNLRPNNFSDSRANQNNDSWPLNKDDLTSSSSNKQNVEDTSKSEIRMSNYVSSSTKNNLNVPVQPNVLNSSSRSTVQNCSIVGSGILQALEINCSNSFVKKKSIKSKSQKLNFENLGKNSTRPEVPKEGIYGSTNQTLPPLVPVSSAKTLNKPRKGPVRKRKLYSPSDFESFEPS